MMTTGRAAACRAHGLQGSQTAGLMDSGLTLLFLKVFPQQVSLATFFCSRAGWWEQGLQSGSVRACLRRSTWL